MTVWRPRGTKRCVDIPQKRWSGDNRSVARKNWTRNREAWKNLEEAIIQQWANTG